MESVKLGNLFGYTGGIMQIMSTTNTLSYAEHNVRRL